MGYRTGLSPGDRLTYSLNGGLIRRDFEIVGIVGAQQLGLLPDSVTIPLVSIPPSTQISDWNTIVDASDDAAVKSAVFERMKSVPNTLTIDAAGLNRLVQQLLSEIVRLPLLIAAICLFVGSVVIANSVALATLERRNEIALLKAIGLQREQVLALLALESAVLGLLGGLIGVGGALGTLKLVLNQASFSSSLMTDTITLPYATAALLIVLVIALAVGAAVLSAWQASAERPAHLLRYE